MYQCLLWKSISRSAKTKKQGFTLIELLVAISLSVLLLTALYGLYLVNNTSYRHSVARAELNQNARISAERISRDIRQTSKIVTVLPPNNTDTLNPPSTTIEFVDGHDTAKLQYLDYGLVNSELHRKIIHYYFPIDTTSWVAVDAKDQAGNAPLESVDEDVIKADKVSSLKFWGSGPIVIEISTSDGTQNEVYQTEILGRNI